MKLKYTPRAIQDLQNIKSYIGQTLQNPKAADRIVKNLLDAGHNLKMHPKLGLSLAEKLNMETDLRCLIRENYLILYRVENETIFVARVLDGRTDYARILFR